MRRWRNGAGPADAAESIADAYWQLHQQPRDAWTFETDLRPFGGAMVIAMVHVEFHFDFGSPNAYLSHVVIPAIEQRTGAQFTYVPILLGGVFKLTNNQSPAVTLRGIRNKAEYQKLETQRFVRRHRIDRFGPIRTSRSIRCWSCAARSRRSWKACSGPTWTRCSAPCGSRSAKMDDPDVARADDRSCGSRWCAAARARAGAGGEGAAARAIPSTRWTAALSARRPSSSPTRCSSARTG